jgi:glyoxylase-like metal-dependent hydrolase (beta-lactamase superfamily II)
MPPDDPQPPPHAPKRPRGSLRPVGDATPREVPLDPGSPAPGVRRFTVPLAFPSPDHLNVYVLDTPEGELLVDCGTVGSESALQAGLKAVEAEPERLLITHAHIDHWGIATTRYERVLAHPGVMQTFRFMGGGDFGSGADYMAAQARLTERFADFFSLIAGIPEVDPIEEGDRLGEWEVLWTPGHDPGHVCLFRERDGVLLCGDVLLPGFTPNIQPAPDGSDALADFLASLERLGELPITQVLPAHGEPYTDAATRSRELIEHHTVRLDTLREAMRQGARSLRDLRDATFAVQHSAREDRFLAALETYAHLDHLRHRGQALMHDDGSWTLAA